MDKVRLIQPEPLRTKYLIGFHNFPDMENISPSGGHAVCCERAIRADLKCKTAIGRPPATAGFFVTNGCIWIHHAPQNTRSENGERSATGCR